MLLNYWVLFFSSFFGGTIDSSEMKNQQPVPVVQNESVIHDNSCSPYPECKLY